MHQEWEKVGEFDVDAGICWIGDPCYFGSIEDSELIDRGLREWDDFCGYLTINEKAGVCEWFNGIGLTVSTGYGDGRYPVYVRRKHGRIAEVRIVFIEDE